MSAADEAAVIHAERAVLGELMYADPTTLVRITGQLGDGEDFWRPSHRAIFEAITFLWNVRDVPPDPAAVREELARRAAEQGATPSYGVEPTYLSDLINAGRPGIDVGKYVRQITEAGDRRRTAEALAHAAERIGKGADVDQVAAGVSRVLAARGQRDQDQGAPPARLPDYPVKAMSVGPLGDLIAKATSTGLPAALVGGAGLGIAAICTMPAVIQPKLDAPDWAERPALWVSLFAPRTGGKSPALRIARAPLDAIERSAYDQWRAERDAWEALAPKEQKQTPTPIERRWTVDDVSIERVLRMLDATNGRVGALVDELQTHLAGMTRYRANGDGGNQARWLSIWDGGAVRYDRVTGGASLRIDQPTVPIVGGLQPHLVAMLGDDESGARARWLPHCSPGVVSAEPAPTSEDWATWVDKAATNGTTRTWYLDDSTYRVWRAAVARWKALSVAVGTGSAAAGAAGKGDRQSLRVALVLAELTAPGKGGPIPPEAMTGAVALVDYAIGVWDVLGGSAETLATSRREETLLRAADRLAAWVAERGGRVTRREIVRATPCGIRTKSQLDTVLAEYRQLYPGAVRDEAPPGGGRVATVVYAPRDPRLSVHHSGVVGTADIGGTHHQDRPTTDDISAGQGATSGPTEIVTVSATSRADIGADIANGHRRQLLSGLMAS
ncbi:DUF3987 domain-containing protein [Pseudofrankia sp. BMG5.37]|uniref:DUF3987 domain-containing protein n=1 Tax=Pseudofrankia sp. BMG5.37 TaxID=3050035 RepID=UPI0028939569|nr:DUF3987 domain-containing protein [Pseudofrankia sp. BMG5.37]MDT3441300.1 DUF3987 domain-containing protein [Pseudofrankia sp. BMG5.37]